MMVDAVLGKGTQMLQPYSRVESHCEEIDNSSGERDGAARLESGSDMVRLLGRG